MTIPKPKKKKLKVEDLMRVTGLGRDTVRAAIRSGELPGYLVRRQYVIPEAAFDDFCHGRWEPRFRPVLRHLPMPAPEDFIQRKGGKSA